MKNRKGITLIALIITIIVLLILAGVSIALVVGDNGIATKAQKAKKNTTLTQAQEELRIAVATSSTNGNGTIYYDDLTNELNKQFGTNGYTISEEDADDWTITVQTSEGNVTELVHNTTRMVCFTVSSLYGDEEITCYAKLGMTWEDYINSDLNEYDFYIWGNDYVNSHYCSNWGRIQKENGDMVYKYEIIEATNYIGYDGR